MNRVELGSSNGFPGVGSYHLSKSAERVQSRLPSYSIGYEERSSIGGNSSTPGVGVKSSNLDLFVESYCSQHPSIVELQGERVAAVEARRADGCEREGT